MPRKSIVIVIVEGITDKISLENCINEAEKDSSIEFFVVNGDMTADFSSNQGNIISKIGDIVRSLQRAYKFRISDVKKIIQIVDTDGVYIPDDRIIEDQTCQNPFYSLDCIRTHNVQNIASRNSRKRSNLHKLINHHEIMKIPYFIYYMSCNLDHVLHNKANSDKNEKKENSYIFSLKYENDIEGFMQFIKSPEVNVDLSYKESWNFIQKDMNSLSRHSNIALFFAPE